MTWLVNEQNHKKLSNSCVIKVVLVAQFSTTCTASSVHVNRDTFFLVWNALKVKYK